MRLAFVVLPAALAFASAGALLMWQSSKPVIIDAPVVSSQPRHPVTPAMEEDAEKRARKEAPDFAKKDFEGKAVEIGKPHAGKLQFVYFVQDGCPCSVEAEPLFHDLWKVHRDKVDFVAVIDKDDKVARQWSVDMLTPYPVVADPQGEVITAYNAPNSAYSALVDEKGRLVKVWPGYSVSILNEMNTIMSEEFGQKPPKIDPKWAPEKASSGCAFSFESKVYGG